MCKYYFEHFYFTFTVLAPLIKEEPRYIKTLVCRYCRWERVYQRLALAERYSYARLEGLRGKVRNLYMQVVDALWGPYPPQGVLKVQLPCNKERWELEEAGRKASIRAERWRELVADNIRCKRKMKAEMEVEVEIEFCLACSHLLTEEEIVQGRCACCGLYFERKRDEFEF